MTVLDFLLARIAEDEAQAPYKCLFIDGCGIVPDDTRALAECKVKRAILDECREDHEDSMRNGDDTTEAATVILYAMAGVYYDHPDYQEWWTA